MLGLGLGIFKNAFIKATKFLFGEYFYDFSEQNTNGFTGAGEGEDVISDYLTGATAVNNYFTKTIDTPFNLKKLEVEFYLANIGATANSNTGKRALMSAGGVGANNLAFGNYAGVGVINEMITFVTSVSPGGYYSGQGSIYYVQGADLPTISIGFHTLIVEWTGSTYTISLDGVSYPVYLRSVESPPTVFTPDPDFQSVVSGTLYIQMREGAALKMLNDDYISKLKMYDDSDSLVVNFQNKYGANGTTYEWDGNTFTRYVGDATKRVTTSVPSQYRIENSSENKEPAILGNALQFDGTDDYVSFTPISNGDVDHSYSMWIKHDEPVTGFNIAYIRSSSSLSEYIGTLNASVIRYRVSAIADFTVPTFVVGDWFHLVITYKSGVGTRLYYNGIESSTGLVAGLQNFKIDNIGRYSTSIYGQKTMDEIAVYDKTLTQAEISGLYNSGNGDYATNYSPANLIAYWRLNGTSGDSTAIDEQGTYNGTLNGFDTDNCWVRHAYYKELAPFTGVAFENDGTGYIDTTSPVVLSGDFTLYAKYKAEDLVYEAILGDNTTGSNGILLYNSTNTILVRINNSSYNNALNGGLVLKDKDYNLIVTRTGTTLRLEIYGEHGVDFWEQTGVSSADMTINTLMSWGSGRQYIGATRMYTSLLLNEALNSTQREQLVTRPELTKNYLVDTVGIDWANVAAFYPLTEGGGDKAYDLSDNKNHGTIINPGWVKGLSTGRQLGLQNVSHYLIPDSTDDELVSDLYQSPVVEDGLTFIYRFYAKEVSTSRKYIMGDVSSNGWVYYEQTSGTFRLNGAWNIIWSGITIFQLEEVNTIILSIDADRNVKYLRINGETPSSILNDTGIPSGRYIPSTLFFQHNTNATGISYPNIPISLQIFEGDITADELAYIEASITNDIRDYDGFSLTPSLILTNKGDYSNWEKVGISGDSFAGTPETITLPEVGFGKKLLEWDTTDYGFSFTKNTGITSGDFTFMVKADFSSYGQGLYFGKGTSGYMLYQTGLASYTLGIKFPTNYAITNARSIIIERRGNTCYRYIDGIFIDSVVNSNDVGIIRTLTGYTTNAFVAPGIIYEAYIWDISLSDNIADLHNDGKVLLNSNSLAIPIIKFKYPDAKGGETSEVLIFTGNPAGKEIISTSDAVNVSERMSYDTFLLECNSQNIIVTDGEIEETFVLRGNGNLRYDGHAGSFVNIKQIQFWFNPQDNTDIEYLMTDEENNRIIYLEGNQIKSDFGLAGVMVADVETNVVLNNTWQLVSIEFYGALSFEEIVFNGDMVGTPGTFSEFKIDKLNMFKAQFTSLLEQFDFIISAEKVELQGIEVDKLYNSGTNKLLKRIGLVGTPEIKEDALFNNQKYFLIDQLEQFKFDTYINNFDTFTLIYISYFGAANHYFWSDEGSGIAIINSQEAIYIYPTPSGFNNVNNIYTPFTNDIFVIRVTGNFTGGSFDIITGSGNRASRTLNARMKYIDTLNLSTNTLKTPLLAVANKTFTDSEINEVGNELATKYGLTWTNI